jgi:hypothetical protein
MSEIGRANLRGGKSGGGFYAVSRNTEMEIVEAKSRKQTSSKREAGLTITLPYNFEIGNWLGNSPGFQMQLEDLRLKYCIPEENSKNNISGRNLLEDYSESADIKEISKNEGSLSRSPFRAGYKDFGSTIMPGLF